VPLNKDPDRTLSHATFGIHFIIGPKDLLSPAS